MAASSYNAPTSETIDANTGSFGNGGTMIAGINGSIDVSFAGSYPQSNQVVRNTGLITASGGGEVSFNAAHAFTRSFGTLDNTGIVDANNGTITIGSDFAQSSWGPRRTDRNSRLWQRFYQRGFQSGYPGAGHNGALQRAGRDDR
jgi:hypothetical protein